MSHPIPPLPAAAAPFDVSAVFDTPKASALIHAGESLFKSLSVGRALDAALLRDAMETAFGGSDATGAWVWKATHELQVL